MACYIGLRVVGILWNAFAGLGLQGLGFGGYAPLLCFRLRTLKRSLDHVLEFRVWGLGASVEFRGSKCCRLLCGRALMQVFLYCCCSVFSFKNPKSPRTQIKGF